VELQCQKMDLDMHRDKVRKLEQELAELTAAETDEKEVTVGIQRQFDASLCIDRCPFMNI